MRYNWPMSAHASQAFSIAHCTDSEDLPQLGLVGLALWLVSGIALNKYHCEYGTLNSNIALFFSVRSQIACSCPSCHSIVGFVLSVDRQIACSTE